MNRRICLLVSLSCSFSVLSGKSVQTHQLQLKAQLQYTIQPMPMLQTSSMTRIVNATVGFTSCFMCCLHLGHLTRLISVNKDPYRSAHLLILHEGHSTLGLFYILNKEKEIIFVNYVKTGSPLGVEPGKFDHYTNRVLIQRS